MDSNDGDAEAMMNRVHAAQEQRTIDNNDVTEAESNRGSLQLRSLEAGWFGDFRGMVRWLCFMVVPKLYVGQFDRVFFGFINDINGISS